MTDSAERCAPPDETIRAAALRRMDTLTKPPGSLGRLEALAAWAASVQGNDPPAPFVQPRLVIFAGDHGTAARTSAFPSEVTGQMVLNLVRGGAAANVLAEQHDVQVRVCDVSVATDYAGPDVPAQINADRVMRGSEPIDIRDAMTVEQSRAALDVGARWADAAIDEGCDLLIAGDMGIGNTTPAAAIIARVTDSPPDRVCGRGTGIDDATWMRKVTVLRDALWRTRDTPTDADCTARTLGGADLAAMAGFLRQAAARGVPAILDGVVTTSAALIAEGLQPGSRDYWVAGHRSAEPAHAIALEHLGLDPLLRLDMRLGEGTGALTALPLLQSSTRLLQRMATFESANVSGGEECPGPCA